MEHTRSRASFLSLAIDMYSRSLHASDAFDDDATTRLCSLWLANFDDLDSGVQYQEVLGRIPSHTFVFLAHQLSARLSASPAYLGNPSQESLRLLITRMCREHPYHSLYQVYCLRSENNSSQSSSRRQTVRHNSPSQLDRGAAAREIFDRLRHDATIQGRVTAVERVCDASLQWAQYPIKTKDKKHLKGPLKVPDDLMITKLHDVQVPVITISTPVDKTMKYDNCVWIHRYESIYTTAGGVNLPKINLCIGTDGRKYKQLVSVFIKFVKASFD